MASARAPALVQLPLTFRKLVCTKLTQNFREAVEVQTVKVTEENLKPNELLIKNRYVGINASDINVTAGKIQYHKTNISIFINHRSLQFRCCTSF